MKELSAYDVDLSFKFKCPKTFKVVEILRDKSEIVSDYSECDLCGQHGDTRLEVECSCGTSHSIILAFS